ncbi:MAG: diadenylate cyclase CdaA [Phycisphaerae bacterium]
MLKLLALQSNLFESLIYPLISGQYSLSVVAAELLLIGVPVYLILRFLSGTRGELLVWGFGMVLMVSFLLVRLVAQRLGMDRINFLYPYFVLAVLAVALVVFQTELRRGLIRIGERGWFHSYQHASQRVIDPILISVSNLSKQKVGALIAVERTTSLGGVIDTGVGLDAEVSAELLESIFWPGSALHDMGVIVREGRMVAARCQFPLADSSDVDRSLGSRHRAAIGMSQECDAIVIVVSEETGTISVAQRGRLRRSLTPESLRDLLLDELSQRSSAPLAKPEPVSRKTDNAGQAKDAAKPPTSAPKLVEAKNSA